MLSGCCPQLAPRPAVLGGGGGGGGSGGGDEGKEEGRGRGGRDGGREEAEWLRRRRAPPPGRGVQEAGKPREEATAAGANAEELLRRPQPGRK